MATDDTDLSSITDARLRGHVEGANNANNEFSTPDYLATVPKLVQELNAAEMARLAGLEHGRIMLGDYELLQLIGSGGTGQVFAARSPASGEVVALKLLNGSRPAWIGRLKREFRILADIRHPNLVELRTLHQLSDGLAFFTMELIEGKPFVEHVRGSTSPGVAPDPARLRRAFIELLAAIEYIHAEGYVHRDLKPSNVLVTEAGRVVVLDFGLVQGAPDRPSAEARVVGTPAYMAPEQTQPGPTTALVDIYAIGVMLFECLCGRRPFDEPFPRLLEVKRERDAPDPSTLVVDVDVDGDLLVLCRRMLARQPSSRPSASEALAMLGSTPRSVQARVGFIGRQVELDALRDGFEAARQERRPVLARVRGPSGQGKSALLRHFARQLGDAALLLHGRCYERESVPYKGFDMIVEALSSQLRQLSPELRPPLPTRGFASLARLFPSLAWLDPAPNEAIPGTPTEQRAMAFDALAELLSALTRAKALVMTFDDVQWADLDCIQLLDALLSTSRPLAALFVLTHRDAETNALSRLDAQLGDANAVRAKILDLQLGPLTSKDGLSLALELIRGDPRDEHDRARAERLLQAAGGSPYYMIEAVRGPDLELELENRKLDQLVARRIDALAPELRTLLERVALIGQPLPRATIARFGADDSVVDALVKHDLLRSTEVEELEAAHDRVREVCVARIDVERLPTLYSELARVLEDHLDSGQIAEFHALAGELERAAKHAERAAERANLALAFGPAATWLERCISWLAADDPRRLGLEIKLAEALGNAGRFAEASELLLKLANRDPSHAHEFRTRAVTHLLRSGGLERGMEAIETLVRDAGLRLERRRYVLVPLLLFSRLRVGREFRHFEARSPDEITPEQRAEIDMCRAVMRGLTNQDTLQTNYWHMRWREAAARYGDRVLYAEALAAEAVIRAAFFEEPGRGKLGAIIDELAGDNPVATRLLKVYELFTALNLRRPNDGLGILTELERLLDGPGDMSWERRQVEELGPVVYLFSGHLRQAIEATGQMYRFGREANNPWQQRYGASLLLNALVSAGELEEAARAFADFQNLRRASPDKLFMYPDLWVGLAWIESLLRRDRHTEARTACARLAADMRAAGLWRVAIFRRQALVATATTELYAQFERPSFASRRRVRALIRGIRSRLPMFHGQADTLEAGLLHLDNKPERALAAWRRAQASFEQVGCRAQLAAVDYRCARLLGGDEGQALRARADAYFAEQRIVDVETFVRTYAPAMS